MCSTQPVAGFYTFFILTDSTSTLASLAMIINKIVIEKLLEKGGGGGRWGVQMMWKEQSYEFFRGKPPKFLVFLVFFIV